MTITARMEAGQRRLEALILKPDELRTLLTAEETTLPDNKSETATDEYIHAYRFQVLTGLRPGELIGLQWGDIQDGDVTVQRSINLSGETTPSKEAPRSFHMPTRAAAELTAQQKLMDELGIQSDYVFPDVRTGGPMTHKEYRQKFQTYCRHHGMRNYIPQALRSTWQSADSNVAGLL